MMNSKERLQASATEAVRIAQNYAVSMYNMESWCDTLDDLRDLAGEDHLFSVNDPRWGARGVTVSYYLKADEGFKGMKVAELLGFLLDLDYMWIREDDYEEGSWKEWKFTFDDSPVSFSITMRFYYGESDKCKMVDTGETEEVAIKELVCE